MSNRHLHIAFQSAYDRYMDAATRLMMAQHLYRDKPDCEQVRAAERDRDAARDAYDRLVKLLESENSCLT